MTHLTAFPGMPSGMPKASSVKAPILDDFHSLFLLADQRANSQELQLPFLARASPDPSSVCILWMSCRSPGSAAAATRLKQTLVLECTLRCWTECALLTTSSTCDTFALKVLSAVWGATMNDTCRQCPHAHGYPLCTLYSVPDRTSSNLLASIQTASAPSPPAHQLRWLAHPPAAVRQ